MTDTATVVAKSGAPDGGGRRRQARLAAVQALYQIDLTGAPVKTVLDEWRLHRLGKEGEGTAGAADRGLFADLVEGTSKRRPDIDAMLTPALAQGWSLERLEIVLRACLRAGIYELISRSDVPARVAINEYVEIARGFFAGREPAFVNGILDRLARRLRPHEFDGQAAAPATGGKGDETAG